MKIDVRSLSSFNRLAQEGATEAAACLTGLTGVETTVEIAKITFVPVAEAIRTADAEEIVGVQVGLSGALSGQAVLAFDPGSADAVVDLLVSDPEAGVDESAIREVGNIVTSGFVDGWAEWFGETIDLTPPTYVEGPVENVLANECDDTEHVVAFSSRVETIDGAISFGLFVLPEPTSLQSGAEPTSEGIDLDKLAGFTELTRQGAVTVSESLSMMTGVETVVDISELSFVAIEELPREVSDRPRVGVVLEFTGPPSGFVAILFAERSARRLLSTLVGEVGEEPFDDFGKSAIREIGNVTASSFLDGWANVLETTVEVSTPRFVHDIGQAIVDPVVVHLGRTQEHAFAFDATIEADDDLFDCTILAIPNEAELTRALADLDVDRVADGRARRLPFDES